MLIISIKAARRPVKARANMFIFDVLKYKSNAIEVGIEALGVRVQEQVCSRQG